MAETVPIADILERVCVTLIKHLPDLHIGKQGRVTVGKYTRYEDNGKAFNSLEKLLRTEEQIQIAEKAGGKLYVELQKGQHGSEFFKALFNALEKEEGRDRRPPPAEELGEIYFNSSIKTPLADLKLIKILKEPKKGRLYDPKYDLIHDIHHDVIIDRAKKIMGKDTFDNWLGQNSEDCVEGYVPGEPRIFENLDKQQKVFNTWTDAAWKKDWKPEEGIECPKIFSDFMEALIPDFDDRYSTYAWLRDAVFDRAEPVLVLCGKPGIGKNILVKDIAGNLVGLNNYKTPSRGFSTSSFHSGVGECRVFFFDETALTVALRETLKEYHGGQATLNEKYEVKKTPEKIHASFALANNDPAKISLDYIDRKFFTPKLAETSILVLWGRDKVTDFVQRLNKDESLLKAIASFLYYNFKHQEAVHFKRNAFYKTLCLGSFAPYIHIILHACASAPSFTNRAIAKHSGVNIPAHSLKSELKRYEDHFQEKIGVLKLDPLGGWTIDSLIYKGVAF